MNSTTQFEAFPQQVELPSLDQWVAELPKAPAKGMTPEQVRTHYSPQVVEEAQKWSGPTNVDALKAELPVWQSDEEGTSVNLPSKFVFYEWKELYVGTLRGKHLAKLARAHQEKNPRLTGEVVSSILRIPGASRAGLAFDLTMPDFFWVLYFLRKSNFTKTAFNHTTRCRNPAHIQKVVEGKASPESLFIKQRIDTTKLAVTELEEVPPLPEGLEELGFHIPTYGDFILAHENGDVGDEEYSENANVACWIYPDRPWAQRIDAAENLPASVIEAIKSMEEPLDFGVEEKAVVTCKECGASMETLISIDASAFLPNKFS